MATFTAGQVLTAAQLNALFDSAQTAWTAYTPGWAASTTAPAIGNGTITGKYKQIGKTVFFWISIAFGSTTTAGSGSYQFGFPVPPLAGQAPLFTAYVVNGTTNFLGVARQSGSIILANTGNANDVGNATPGAWVSGNSIRIAGSYEAA